jgi:hypothetical protein
LWNTDNNPEFPKPELSLTIPESSEVGYVLFISTAADPDSGVKETRTRFLCRLLPSSRVGLFSYQLKTILHMDSLLLKFQIAVD